MTIVTFDTLKFVEKLKAAGVPEGQAKAMSETFQEAQGELNVAPKRDLKEAVSSGLEDPEDYRAYASIHSQAMTVMLHT
jgi:hypothetical protein